MIDHPATLQELSNEHAKKQPHMVEYLTEEAPILAGIKFEESSHPLWNVGEKVTGIEGAGFVDMNSPLPSMSVDGKLVQTDLKIMGGEIFVPQDKAQAYGGKEKFIAKRMPIIMRDAGMQTEKKIIYDNYLKYAKEVGNITSASGTAADGGLYSLVVVRHVPGENGGLYSPEGFKQGAILDVQPLYGGNLAKDKNGVPGYFVQVKGYFGHQILNPKTTSAIVNISGKKLPTKMQINSALLEARANPANTRIYCHPQLLSWLGEEFKADMIRTENANTKLNFLVSHWNDIPVISSYNFLFGTETEITL